LRTVAELSGSAWRRAILLDDTGSPVSMYVRTTSLKICWCRLCWRTVEVMFSV
jgi:hypothetical protein